MIRILERCSDHAPQAFHSFRERATIEQSHQTRNEIPAGDESSSNKYLDRDSPTFDHRSNGVVQGGWDARLENGWPAIHCHGFRGSECSQTFGAGFQSNQGLCQQLVVSQMKRRTESTESRPLDTSKWQVLAIMKPLARLSLGTTVPTSSMV